MVVRNNTRGIYFLVSTAPSWRYIPTFFNNINATLTVFRTSAINIQLIITWTNTLPNCKLDMKKQHIMHKECQPVPWRFRLAFSASSFVYSKNRQQHSLRNIHQACHTRHQWETTHGGLYIGKCNCEKITIFERPSVSDTSDGRRGGVLKEMPPLLLTYFVFLSILIIKSSPECSVCPQLCTNKRSKILVTQVSARVRHLVKQCLSKLLWLPQARAKKIWLF